MLTKEGIILKTIPYLEQAKIAHVLTEAGKESFIIRGASKMKSSNRAMAQMLTKIAFNATEKGTLRTITESKVLDDYDAIKQDYDKMQSVYPILEKLYSFSDQVNNARTLYEFTSQILELLLRSKYHQTISNLFDLKLTYLLGIGPNFGSCSHCEKTEDLQFVASEGGVLCPSCMKPEFAKSSVQMTQLIKYLYLIKIGKVNEQFLEAYENITFEIEEIIDGYYLQFLGFQSSTKKVIKRMNK